MWVLLELNLDSKAAALGRAAVMDSPVKYDR